ncbi:MAG: lipopolysaccharide heptosyltransferase II [Candidatus Acidiferrales bacterium]
MKIAVRATNWVGDAILSIPALEAIRRSRPGAEITILARSWVAELYRGQPFVDRLLVLDGQSDVVRKLRDDKFDCAIILPNSFASAWPIWRAGIPERIGYARDARSVLLTKAIPPPRQGEIPAHEIFYYQELLRRAGWADGAESPSEIRLKLDPSALESAAEALTRSGAPAEKKRIALAAGAAYGSAKCWPPERFAAVADALAIDFGASVILFGAPSELGISQSIAAQMRHRPIDMTGETSIGQLAAFFANCDCFLGNDSGAMHVAAAAGLPVVAIFGSTDPHGTAPVTSRRSLIREQPSCSPCFLRRCPVDHRCMTRIEAGGVISAVRGWLEKIPRV